MIKYEGTKQKLMEMVNFIFFVKNNKISGRIIRQNGRIPDIRQKNNWIPDIQQKSISGRIISGRTLIFTPYLKTNTKIHIYV